MQRKKLVLANTLLSTTLSLQIEPPVELMACSLSLVNRETERELPRVDNNTDPKPQRASSLRAQKVLETRRAY